MNYTDKLTLLEKDTGGMSPAQVYRCRADGMPCYLKKIDSVYRGTTYSVLREAEVMRWLSGRLHVPRVLQSARTGNAEYLLMSELPGRHIDCFADDPVPYITCLADAVRRLQAVDIADCPFCTGLDVRLRELDYLLRNGLADTDPENRDKSAKFTDPLALYDWLCRCRPEEKEPVFSHGDLPGNFLVADGEPYFFDLARCGIADKWQDIALCVREIRSSWPERAYEALFFDRLGIEPDPQKIEYYILLDELF